jgi:hypothetical protein
MDNACPYKPSTYFVKLERIYLDLLGSLSPNEGIDNDANDEVNLAEKLNVKYQNVDVNEVAQQQQHLIQKQRDKLSKLLSKFPKLFSGKLGLVYYPHHKLHLDLVENLKPVHKRPFPVAHVHLDVFLKELHHLVELGVLSKCGASTQWAAPTFIIPKKDGRVR